jgi:hypothetical protein
MTAARRASRQRHHHHVYVVELHDRVWNEARFRAANPEYQLGKPVELAIGLREAGYGVWQA